MSPSAQPPSTPHVAVAPPDAPPSPHRVLKSVALLLARHEIRSLRRWFDDFDRDILLPILLGEIALHNIGALQNGVARRAGTRIAKALPANAEVSAATGSALKPCNAYSIAAATGLPRETVRRKIEQHGTSNFPEVAGRKLYGELTMVITVNHTGQVLDTEVVQGSGKSLLDRRAQAIVRGLSFGRFNEGMRRQADQIVVVSRFRFTRDETLQTQLSGQ